MKYAEARVPKVLGICPASKSGLSVWLRVVDRSVNIGSTEHMSPPNMEQRDTKLFACYVHLCILYCGYSLNVLV